jgi:uncharacterized protein (TIGR02271 family)
MDYGTTGTRTVTAFFDSRSDADEAVAGLMQEGIPRANIQLVPGAEGGTMATSRQEEGGFWETLKDIFMPDEDRYTYAEGLRRGGFLVTVTGVGTAEYSRVLDILDSEGTVNLDERVESWRTEGWSGYEGWSGRDTGTLEPTSDTEEVIPVAEEELRVGKRDVSHGKVRVRSYIVEEPVSEDVNLRDERVRVERRPADRPLSGDERLFQDRTIDVEERGEEAVVDKSARVKEEVAVKKDVERRTEHVSDTVRRTEVEIEDERGTPLPKAGRRR